MGVRVGVRHQALVGGGGSGEPLSGGWGEVQGHTLLANEFVSTRSLAYNRSDVH